MYFQKYRSIIYENTTRNKRYGNQRKGPIKKNPKSVQTILVFTTKIKIKFLLRCKKIVEHDVFHTKSYGSDSAILAFNESNQYSIYNILSILKLEFVCFSRKVVVYVQILFLSCIHFIRHFEYNFFYILIIIIIINIHC